MLTKGRAGMRLNLWVVAMALAIAGCGKSLDPAEVELINTAKSYTVADPSSTEFRNVEIHEETGAVCGEYNARKKSGEMTGFTRFLYNPATELGGTEAQGLGEAFEVVWDLLCY